jgi:hypothetical protein
VEKSELHGKQYFSLNPEGNNTPGPGPSVSSFEGDNAVTSTPTHGDRVPVCYSHTDVLLLPAFDEYVIAYSGRDAIIAKEHQPKSFTTNGIFRPTIVAQGRVVGTWRKTTTGKKQIELSYFSQPSKALEKRLAKAVERFNRFKA